MELVYAHVTTQQRPDGREVAIHAARVSPDGWPFNVYLYRARTVDGTEPGPWTYGADSNCTLGSEREAWTAMVNTVLDLAYHFITLRGGSVAPSTNNHQPPTTNQEPTTSNQQPATNNQQPATTTP